MLFSAYDDEKDDLVLFLQAALTPNGKVKVACGQDTGIMVLCEADSLGKYWLPRRPQAFYESENSYDADGRLIPESLRYKCPHGLHVIEGWSAGLGMAVSCYICYETFFWSMKRREYVPADLLGPLECPSREALSGFLNSSLEYCPDYVDAALLRRLKCEDALV